MSGRHGKRPRTGRDSPVVLDRPEWKGPTASLLPDFRLDVHCDNALVDSIRAGDQPCTIFGRDALCDAYVDHPSVSRHHAAVLINLEKRAFVVDLGSAHGTFVNNEKLGKNRPVVLQNGHVLRFGIFPRAFIVRGIQFAHDDVLRFGVSQMSVSAPALVDSESTQELLTIYNTALNQKRTTAPEPPPLSCPESDEQQPHKKRRTRKILFCKQAEFVSRSGDVHKGRHVVEGDGPVRSEAAGEDAGKDEAEAEPDWGHSPRAVRFNTSALPPPLSSSAPTPQLSIRLSSTAKSRSRRRRSPPPPKCRSSSPIPPTFPFSRFLQDSGSPAFSFSPVASAPVPVDAHAPDHDMDDPRGEGHEEEEEEDEDEAREAEERRVRRGVGGPQPRAGVPHHSQRAPRPTPPRSHVPR